MDSPSWLVIGGVITLLGLGGVLVPAVAEPSPDATQYRLSVDSTSGAPPDSDVVAFEELPPEAQQAFETARTGETVILTRAHNETALDAFYANQYVRYRDQAYQIQLIHVDGAGGSNVALRMVGGFLTALGGALVVYGGFVARSQQLRALTPRRSLLLPVGAALAFYLSPASITGGFLSLPPSSLSQSLIGLPAIALMVPGTLYARGRNREAIGVCLFGGLLLALGLGWAGNSLIGVASILVFVIIIGGTLGAVPFAIGARLTESGTGQR